MPRPISVPVLLFIIWAFSSPALAFGAGEIPDSNTLDGWNWKHGDIANVLLTLPVSFVTKKAFPFTELLKRAVYFGNWLRDYSQLIDISALEMMGDENPSKNEALLLCLVSVLAFFEFGFATDEFEVTQSRLGCYRPEEHIDNPKGYEGGTKYAGIGLRGPYNAAEGGIDPATGMKKYVAYQPKPGETPFDTSDKYIKQKLTDSIAKGRSAKKSAVDSADFEKTKDFKDALISLGAALHTLEDFAAHSNFTELSLIEIDSNVDHKPPVFPFVGEGCPQVTVPNQQNKNVWPLVTGTFGPLDVYQSILGEVDDHVAVQQGEKVFSLEELTMKLDGVKGNAFDVLCDGVVKAFDTLGAVLGTDVTAIKAAVEDMRKNVKSVRTGEIQTTNNVQAAEMFNGVESEEQVQPAELVDDPSLFWKMVKPAFEVHDGIMRILYEPEFKIVRDIREFLLEEIKEFIFSFLSFFLQPALIELRRTIENAKKAISEKQQTDPDNVFTPNSTSSDPTHSDLAKDHFSNVLNPIAGRLATAVTNWTAQRIVKCWDDENLDADIAIQEILKTLHHPAFSSSSEIQQIMATTVKDWWSAHDAGEQDTLRDILSREAVQSGKNNPLKSPSFKKKDEQVGFAKFSQSQPHLDSRQSGIAKPIEDVVSMLREELNRFASSFEEVSDVASQTYQEAERYTDVAFEWINSKWSDLSKVGSTGVDVIKSFIGRLFWDSKSDTERDNTSRPDPPKPPTIDPIWPTWIRRDDKPLSFSDRTAEPDTKVANWMQALLTSNQSISTSKLSETICIPTSHNAGMWKTTWESSPYGEAKDTVTQSVTIRYQLAYGARQFDFWPYLNLYDNKWYSSSFIGQKDGKEEMRLGELWWRGATGASIEECIQCVNDFTASHKELIILNFSNFSIVNLGNMVKVTKDQLRTFIQILKKTLNFIYPYTDLVLEQSSLSHLLRAGTSSVIVQFDETLHQLLTEEEFPIHKMALGTRSLVTTDPLQLKEFREKTNEPNATLLSFWANQTSSILPLLPQETLVAGADVVPPEIIMSDISNTHALTLCLGLTLNRQQILSNDPKPVIVYGGTQIADETIVGRISDAIAKKQSLAIENTTFGADPDYGYGKSCVIFYTEDNIRKARFAFERSKIDFIPDVTSVTWENESKTAYYSAVYSAWKRQAYLKIDPKIFPPKNVEDGRGTMNVEYRNSSVDYQNNVNRVRHVFTNPSTPGIDFGREIQSLQKLNAPASLDASDQNTMTIIYKSFDQFPMVWPSYSPDNEYRLTYQFGSDQAKTPTTVTFSPKQIAILRPPGQVSSDWDTKVAELTSDWQNTTPNKWGWDKDWEIYRKSENDPWILYWDS